MQAHIRNAVALDGIGEYDFKGPKGEIYRYLDLYNSDAGEVVRLSLGADCTPPAAGIEFGTRLDLWAEIVANEKIVRGEDRDRSMKSLKLRLVSIELAKPAQATRPVAAAAA